MPSRACQGQGTCECRKLRSATTSLSHQRTTRDENTQSQADGRLPNLHRPEFISATRVTRTRRFIAAQRGGLKTGSTGKGGQDAGLQATRDRGGTEVPHRISEAAGLHGARTRYHRTSASPKSGRQGVLPRSGVWGCCWRAGFDGVAFLTRWRS